MVYKTREEIHESLIKTRVRGYQAAGHTRIKADHIDGYDEPKQIYDHIPDITSWKDGVFYVTEAETCDSFNDETVEQWEDFERYAGEHNNVKFHVVVPESCLKEAKKFAEENDIEVDKWYYNKAY